MRERERGRLFNDALFLLSYTSCFSLTPLLKVRNKGSAVGLLNILQSSYCHCSRCFTDKIALVNFSLSYSLDSHVTDAQFATDQRSLCFSSFSFLSRWLFDTTSCFSSAFYHLLMHSISNGFQTLILKTRPTGIKAPYPAVMTKWCF